MIAVDTNVLLRRLLNDDAMQAEKARQLFETQESVLVTDVVLAETIWTLTGKRYGAAKEELGAVVMGLRHGLFCMGCCAPLMLLLFAVAVMDLRWVVALTVLVTSEKLLPGASIWRLTIGAGLVAIALGLAVVGWKSA